MTSGASIRRPSPGCGRVRWRPGIGSPSPTPRAASTRCSSPTAEQFHTAKGAIAHDDLIGGPGGGGGDIDRAVSPTWRLRPLLRDVTVKMPRGAAVVYPKDAAQILTGADIFPGARVLEAGVGSGALTLSACCARSDRPGRLISYERREDFAEIARRNVESFLGRRTPGLGSPGRGSRRLPCRPIRSPRRRSTASCWTCWRPGTASGGRRPAGARRGVLLLRRHHHPTGPYGGDAPCPHRLHRTRRRRDDAAAVWQAEGLAVRPQHAMIGHTGFLIFARRLAPGVSTPLRKRRPAPGAYGEDYLGPR